MYFHPFASAPFHQINACIKMSIFIAFTSDNLYRKAVADNEVTDIHVAHTLATK